MLDGFFVVRSAIADLRQLAGRSINAAKASLLVPRGFAALPSIRGRGSRMSDVENPEEPFVPRYDPVTHPFYYAALEPPHERPFHSYSTLSGRPPTAAEVACMRSYFSRFRHYRFKSKTYENGWRVDCLWLIDGVEDARDYFDRLAKEKAKKLNRSIAVSRSETYKC